MKEVPNSLPRNCWTPHLDMAWFMVRWAYRKTYDSTGWAAPFANHTGEWCSFRPKPSLLFSKKRWTTTPHAVNRSTQLHQAKKRSTSSCARTTTMKSLVSQRATSLARPTRQQKLCRDEEYSGPSSDLEHWATCRPCLLHNTRVLEVHAGQQESCSQSKRIEEPDFDSRTSQFDHQPARRKTSTWIVTLKCGCEPVWVSTPKQNPKTPYLQFYSLFRLLFAEGNPRWNMSLACSAKSRGKWANADAGSVNFQLHCNGCSLPHSIPMST